MGEYAMYGNHRIKIGTCEDMYYLRADQARMVRHQPGNVDPIKDVDGIRFRFPFPDEDHIEPGAFEDYDRSIPLTMPGPLVDFDHYSVQFSAHAGYLLSIPCPESNAEQPLKIVRNGFAGNVRIVQQRYWKGLLVLVAQCGGCGARYRLPTLADAEPYIVAARSQADQYPDRAAWWHAVADRIAAGYAIRKVA